MLKIVLYKVHLVFAVMHADAVDETFMTPPRICAPVDETFTLLFVGVIAQHSFLQLTPFDNLT